MKTKTDKAARKQRADWKPSQINDVSQKFINDSFFSQAALKLPVPELAQSSSTSFKTYPHQQYGLPSEETIGNIVKGNFKGAGSLALSRDDVTKTLSDMWRSKVGLQHKINEVLDRRTVEKNGTLKWHDLP